MKRMILIVVALLALFVFVTPASAQDGAGQSGEIIGAGATLVYVVIGALAGGVGAIGAMLLGVRFVLNSPVLIAAMENLANSFPPDVKDLIHDLGALLKEVADDIPYEDKDTAGVG